MKKTTRSTARKATQKAATDGKARSSSDDAQDRGAARDAAQGAANDSLFGLSLRPWTASARVGGKAPVLSPKTAQVFVFGGRDPKALRSAVKSALLPWQLENAAKSDAETLSYAGRLGPVFILQPPSSADERAANTHSGRLEKSGWARARDQMGALVPSLVQWKVETVVVRFVGTSAEAESAAITGLEMGGYSFAENRDNPRRQRRKLPKIVLQDTALKPADVRAAADLGLAVNTARHLINLPGGTLDPESYAQSLETLFSESESMTVEVWRGDKLRDERMNLLLAVGSGAASGPCLVHLRYRPQGAEGRKPIALVGKGITFDSGGLDIKPSSAMRLMKKDMGGSAALVGAALWLERSGLAQPVDLYFALAENAIDSGSFRPGDIITARNGLTVEIHNTDAEGRLVLADALDVAVTQEGEDAPLSVINLATLTGAIKVALGAEIAGLFCNNDGLATLVEDAGLAAGELTWRMPLFAPYKNLLRSNFADMANASDGFAGAITAAIFLQQFVGDAPWAHLDIYAWRDGASGAWTEAGGSGQGVQMLARLLARMAREGVAAPSPTDNATVSKSTRTGKA